MGRARSSLARDLGHGGGATANDLPISWVFERQNSQGNQEQRPPLAGFPAMAKSPGRPDDLHDEPFEVRVWENAVIVLGPQATAVALTAEAAAVSAERLREAAEIARKKA